MTPKINGFVSTGPIRAATFFTLAFVLMAIGGASIGEFQTGVKFGLALGVAFGIFAYFFIKPTEETADQPTE